MTKAFEKMLYLFGDGARGKVSEIDIGEDIEEIREIAIRNSIWQTVYLALPEAYKSIYKGEIIASLSKNVQRNVFVINVIETLKRNGIDVILIKGMSVSQFYKDPDLRISGDTDILIEKSKENTTKKVLEEYGFKVYNREKKSHHFLAMHPVGSLLEVHISLYDKSAQKFLFLPNTDEKEDCEEVTCYGKTMKTLGVTSGLQFLLIHYVRHFVAEGVGVRQLMDLLLYMEHYADKIDDKKLEKALKESGYEKLVYSLKAIGNKYLGFCFPNVDFDHIAEHILADMSEGGTFGSEENTGFYKLFLKKRAQKLNVSYGNYWVKQRIIKLWERVFPSSYTMRTHGYDYARNVPLLFVAYLHRCLNVFLRPFIKEKTSKSKGKAKDPGDRMRLMKELEII